MGGSPEASILSCCRRGERKRHESEPGGHTEAAPGGNGRQGVPSGLWAGAAGNPRRRRKVGAAPEGHWGRKMAEGRSRAAGRILGRWKIEGTEPCRVCEEDEEKRGRRNLLGRRRRKQREE